MKTFMHDYPVSLKGALLVPCLEALVLQAFGQSVCWPAQTGTERFVGCFGHSQTAFRTALSRAKKQGEVIVFKDAKGIKRIEPGSILKNYTHYFLAEPFLDSSFSLLLFHFSTHENKRRYALKELLANLNYVMLTQNAYLRYGNYPEQIDALLAQHGFSENVYHFSGLEQIPERLQKRIAELYQTELWAEKIRDYQQRFYDYLEAESSGTEEAYMGYLHTRTAFHHNILSQAPALPEAYFPEAKITQEIFQALEQYTRTNVGLHTRLFQQIFA